MDRRHRRRMAIVHPWVLRARGAERVFFELARTFPQADLFLLHHNPEALPPDLRGRLVATSFLDRRAVRALPYRWLLPMLPLAAESLPLRDYDLVLSSSYGWAHGVVTGDSTRHISYMHSPPRHVWGEDPGMGNRLRPALNLVLHYGRMWDERAASRVDEFIANSELTAQRIQKRYRRDAEVIHPPVDIERFRHVRPDPRGYLLAIGELVRYKRFDLAIEAARRARRPLVIVGDGPERASLEALAGDAEVRFAGRVTDAQLETLMGGASALLHPGVEDFGIVMVEALAAGLPVIASAEGGAPEILGRGPGVLVRELDAEAYADAIATLEHRHLDVCAARERAERFGIARFRAALCSLVGDSSEVELATR
ncbi:MAG: glycosyltransferase [Dehalococcoidia bacterium]